jgi:hypothetical protein
MCYVERDTDLFVTCEKCNKHFNMDKCLLSSENATTFILKESIKCPSCNNDSTKILNKNDYLRNQWERNHPQFQTQQTPPQVHCPKCGSTQIQAVPRKWSLLTGFLTNKIDRVCLNCKNKF